jgi:hypothetical protein
MRKQRVPIYWDHGGATHACQSTKIDGGVRLVWTLCDIDVPHDEAYWFDRGAAGAEITCSQCLVAAARPTTT